MNDDLEMLIINKAKENLGNAPCYSPSAFFEECKRLQELADGEAWCPICEEHMLTHDDKCVECGARTKPIGAK